MLEVDLQRRLSSIREHTAGHTKNDLSSNDTNSGVLVGATAVMNEETKSDHEERHTNENKDLEPADFVDDETEQSADNDTDKRVERSDSSGRQDGKVKRHLQHGKQIITLQGPRKVEKDGNSNGGPDRPVLHQLKGDKRVRTPQFPVDENRNAANTDHERRNNVSLLPGALEATGDGQGSEDEAKDGNNENNANDVQQPEEFLEKRLPPELLERRLVVIEAALLLGATGHKRQTDDQRHGAHRVDDAPHADSPVPFIRAGHDVVDNVAADPGVDDEGQGRDVAEEETGAGGRNVGNDDLDQQQNHGVSNLVNHTAASKRLDVLGRCFDDAADDVKQNGHANQLDSSKDIGNLGGCRLCSSGNDGSHDIDGGQKRVLAEFVGRIGLVRVAKRSVQAVRICNKQHRQENKDSVGRRDGGRDGFHPDYTGRANVFDCFHYRLVLVGVFISRLRSRSGLEAVGCIFFGHGHVG